MVCARMSTTTIHGSQGKRKPNKMANDLSRYIQAQMDAHGWNNAELARRSGLEHQHVSKLRVNGDLKTIPDAATLAGLAKAFGVSEREVLLTAARAVGVRVDAPAPVVAAGLIDNADLLAELGRRLAQPQPDSRPRPLDLNKLEARALHQADELMTRLEADAAASLESGNPGLAALQDHLAKYVLALLNLAHETNGGSQRENGPAQPSDQSARP